MSSSGASPSIAVLGFQATVTGSVGGDLLGVVDPLVSATPGAGCQLRDVTERARALGGQDVRVELDALPDLAVELPTPTVLRPSPRVYPEVASAVGGVVSESAPVDLTDLPPRLTLVLPEGDRTDVALPDGHRLLAEDGTPFAPGQLDAAHDLVLQVEGPQPQKTLVELRPLYTTLALACPVDPRTGRVTIRGSELAQLARSGGAVPVSVEAIWRDSMAVGNGMAGRSGRLSVEVHASAVVSLKR